MKEILKKLRLIKMEKQFNSYQKPSVRRKARPVYSSSIIFP